MWAAMFECLFSYLEVKNDLPDKVREKGNDFTLLNDHEANLWYFFTK